MTKLEFAVSLALIGAVEADDKSMEAGGALKDAMVAAWGMPTKSKACKATAAMQVFRKALGAEKINDTMKANAKKAFASLDKMGQAARKYTRLNTAWAELKHGKTRGKIQGSKKRGSKARSGKAIVVPMTPKGVGAMAKAAIAALSKLEKATFPSPQAVAAWQALAAVYAKKVSA